MSSTCVICGLSLDTLGLDVRSTIIWWSDAPRLASLLKGELDHLACPACGQALDAVPGVAVALDHPPALLVCLGTLTPEDARLFVEKLYLGVTIANSGPAGPVWPSDTTLREAVDIGELKRLLLARLMPGFLEALALIDERGSSFGAYVRKSWRRLIPSVFAAGLVLARVEADKLLPPGSSMSTKAEVVTSDELLETLETAQALAWTALATCPRTRDGAPSLEQDLSRYVDSSVILPAAPECLSSLLEDGGTRDSHLGTSRADLQATDETLLTSYAREALRAAVLAAGCIDNPSEREWAERYLDLELRVRSGSVAASLVAPYRVSIAFGQKTLPRAPTEFALRRVIEATEPTPGLIALLREATTELGHAGLVEQVLGASLAGLARQQATIPTLFAPTAASDEDVLMELAIAGKALPPMHRPCEIDQLAKLAHERSSSSLETHAQIELWRADALLSVGRPAEVLDKLGQSPADWESQLDPSLRCLLMLRRADARLAIGHVDVAMEVHQQILSTFSDLDSSARRQFDLRAARLSRETGRPDFGAVLLWRATPGISSDERVSFLLELAYCCSVLGKFGDALATLDEALAAAGTDDGRAPLLIALRAQQLGRLGRVSEAVDVLRKLPDSRQLGPIATLAAADTWIELRSIAEECVPIEQLVRVSTDLAQLADLYRGSYTSPVSRKTLHLRGWLAEVTGEHEIARKLWKVELRVYGDLDSVRNAEALAWLALHAYEAGDLTQARRYLV